MSDSSEKAVVVGLRHDLVEAIREMSDEAVKALANTALSVLMERSVAARHPEGTDADGFWLCPVEGCGMRIHVPVESEPAVKALTAIDGHKARHDDGEEA